MADNKEKDGKEFEKLVLRHIQKVGDVHDNEQAGLLLAEITADEKAKAGPDTTSSATGTHGAVTGTHGTATATHGAAAPTKS